MSSGLTLLNGAYVDISEIAAIACWRDQDYPSRVIGSIVYLKSGVGLHLSILPHQVNDIIIEAKVAAL